MGFDKNALRSIVADMIAEHVGETVITFDPHKDTKWLVTVTPIRDEKVIPVNEIEDDEEPHHDLCTENGCPVCHDRPWCAGPKPEPKKNPCEAQTCCECNGKGTDCCGCSESY